MWIEVFKTGKHKDASGREKDWSQEDLDQIIQLYDPKEHQAPVVLGHPKDDAPAYGWVSELKREGNVLLAKLVRVSKKLKEWVNQGSYQKRSISLYPDLTLRHVGFLGAQPPAVKGLKDFSFSDQGKDLIGLWSFEESIEEEEGSSESMEKTVSPEEKVKVLERIIEAQRLEIDRLKDSLRKQTEESEQETSEENTEEEEVASAQFEDDEKSQGQEPQEEKEEASLMDRLEAMAKELAELKRNMTPTRNFTESRLDVRHQIDLALAQGRILPAWKEAGLESILMTLDQAEANRNFSEGETRPVELFWNFLDSAGVRGLYGRYDFTEMPSKLSEEEKAMALGEQIAQSTGYRKP